MKGIDHELEARVVADLERDDIDAAATRAIRGYGPQVFGYLTAVLRDETRAADAFSIFSENLWVSLRSFKREASLRTWAYKIAFGAAMRIVRDPYRRRARRAESERIEAIAAEVRTATAQHLRTERKDAIRRLREELDEDERTLLVLRIDRDLDWREIADVVGAEEPTVRKRFERVKAKLKRLAREHGIAADGDE